MAIHSDRGGPLKCAPGFIDKSYVMKAEGVLLERVAAELRAGRDEDALREVPGILILVLGPDGEIELLNREAESYVEGEGLGPSFFEEVFLPVALEALREGEGDKATIAVTDTSGTPRRYLVHQGRTPDGRRFLAFREVTKEFELIHDFAFLKKEAAAAEVLKRRWERQAKELSIRLQRLLRYLPDAVCSVDEEFRIGLHNLESARVFSGPAPERCYGLFGLESPCEGCPLVGGREGRAVVGHEAGGRSITETVSLFEEGGALLTFRDTTRQVQLIEKIREQRDTIERQRGRFECLVGLMMKMQSGEEPAEVTKTFVKALVRESGAEAGFVLVEGLRRGSLWLRAEEGLGPESLEAVTGAYLKLPLRSQGFDVLGGGHLPGGAQGWFQIPLSSLEGRQMGLLALKRGEEGLEEGLVTLFVEPFRAYVNGLLLRMRLEERANTDELTGLYNRRYFMGALSQEAAKAEEYGVPFSVIAIDVNGLKYVNDTFGHQYGDELIRAVASILKDTCRETDVAARMGGDEFSVLLPNTPSEGAECLAKRIKAAASRRALRPPGGEPVPVALSIGWSGSDATLPSKVVREADEAMYRDKEEYYRTHERYR